jgi:hypothetical protein
MPPLMNYFSIMLLDTNIKYNLSLKGLFYGLHLMKIPQIMAFVSDWVL